VIWDILHYRIMGDVYVELGVVFWALLHMNNTFLLTEAIGSFKYRPNAQNMCVVMLGSWNQGFGDGHLAQSH